MLTLSPSRGPMAAAEVSPSRLLGKGREGTGHGWCNMGVTCQAGVVASQDTAPSLVSGWGHVHRGPGCHSPQTGRNLCLLQGLPFGQTPASPLVGPAELTPVPPRVPQRVGGQAAQHPGHLPPLLQPTSLLIQLAQLSVFNYPGTAFQAQLPPLPVKPSQRPGCI